LRRRKNFRRHTGHRQKHTRVLITGISVPGLQVVAPADPAWFCGCLVWRRSHGGSGYESLLWAVLDSRASRLHSWGARFFAAL